jgi:hypothetical protein
MNNLSRTLSLPKSISETLQLTEDLSSCVNITGGDKFTYYICKNFEVAKNLELLLSINNIKLNRSTYSLFVRYLNPNNKSSNDIHKDLLYYVKNLIPEINVTYSRIDETSNTGKLCIDLYDDYIKLKSLNENSEFRFFAFNPKRNLNHNNHNNHNNRHNFNQNKSTRGSFQQKYKK